MMLEWTLIISISPWTTSGNGILFDKKILCLSFGLSW
jgi:hypothetical protein